MRSRRLHVRLGHLCGEEIHRQQLCRCVVDVHDQCARQPAILEPSVWRAVDLHQVPETLPPGTALVHANLPARFRPPQAVRDNPLPQRLCEKPQAVDLDQLLDGRKPGRSPSSARSLVPSPRAAPLPPWRCSTACPDAPKPDPTAPARGSAPAAASPDGRSAPAARPPLPAAGASPPPARSRPPDPTPSCSAFLPVTPKAPPPSRTKGDTLTLHKGDITALGLHEAPAS